MSYYDVILELLIFIRLRLGTVKSITLTGFKPSR